jgi:hypothetical protein
VGRRASAPVSPVILLLAVITLAVVLLTVFVVSLP